MRLEGHGGHNQSKVSTQNKEYYGRLMELIQKISHFELMASIYPLIFHRPSSLTLLPFSSDPAFHSSFNQDHLPLPKSTGSNYLPQWSPGIDHLYECTISQRATRSKSRIHFLLFLLFITSHKETQPFQRVSTLKSKGGKPF